MNVSTAVENTMLDAGGAAMTHWNIHTTYGAAEAAPARQAIGGWNAAAAENLDSTATSIIDNVPDGTYTTISVHDALAAGTEGGRGPIGATQTRAFSALTSGVFHSAAHGFNVDDQIMVADLGMAFPTGVSVGDVVFVGTVPDVDSFTLSTTAANANPVTITGAGTGVCTTCTPITVAGAPQQVQLNDADVTAI